MSLPVSSSSIACAVALLACTAGFARAGQPDRPGEPVRNVETDAVCRRLRAEARSNASLLFAPRVHGQLVHLSGAAAMPTDPLAASGTQVRSSLSVSPLDMLRGRLTMRAADAECRRALAARRLEHVLRQGPQYGVADALRAQIDDLAAALPRVDRMVRDAEARLARQIIAAGEVELLRGRSRGLRAELFAARHELALLQEMTPGTDADGSPPAATAAALGADLGAFENATLAAERERSSLRRLSPWQVDLRFGVVAVDDAQWFGMVELSYSLGDPFQRGAERAYLDARADELRLSEAEARDRAARFASGMRESAVRLAAEIDAVDQELARIERDRAGLAAAAGERAEARRALAELDAIELGARRTYLVRLREARVALGGEER